MNYTVVIKIQGKWAASEIRSLFEALPNSSMVRPNDHEDAVVFWGDCSPDSVGSAVPDVACECHHVDSPKAAMELLRSRKRPQ